MNGMNIMQQMTGVRLFNEEKRMLTNEEYLNFKAHIENNWTENDQISNKEICEIYFDPKISTGYQPEQFMLAVEKKGNNRKFLLKRRNKIGSFESEKAIKISKKEYRNILQGSIDWMKDSKKVLLSEFYCKMKLFQYRISKILKCYREEIYLKCEQILLIVNKEIKEYHAGNSIMDISTDNNRVLVLARYNVNCNDDEVKRPGLNQLMND